MSSPEGVKYHLDPSSVRIFQELAHQHPTKIDNDGTLTREEALDLFDGDQDGQISAHELFSVVSSLTGIFLKNFRTVEWYLRRLVPDILPGNFSEVALRKAGIRTLEAGVRYFAIPTVTEGPLLILSKPSTEEIWRLLDAHDLLEAEQWLNDLFVIHGAPLPADRSQLSEEESNQRIDWVLSWLPIHKGYDQNVFTALLLHLPQMSEDRKNLLLGYALQFSHQANVVTLLEGPLSKNQQEMICHDVMNRGTDTEILQLEQRYPDLVRKLRSEQRYVEKAGYVHDLGREHFIDQLPDEADAVSIHVHPFFSMTDTYQPSSRSELLQAMERLACEGNFFEALDLYQELQRIEGLVREGKQILFVLGRCGSVGVKWYTDLLKDILGGYQNFYFVESKRFNRGGLVGYNGPILARKLRGKQLTFSGGYVGRCLEGTIKSLAALGLRGDYDVSGSSVYPEDIPDSVTLDLFPRFYVPGFEGSRASLDRFFCQHTDLVSQYDRIVAKMLRDQ